MWVVYFNDNEVLSKVNCEPKADWDSWAKRHGWSEDTTDPVLVKIRLICTCETAADARRIKRMGYEAS
jgi:hypothetical protein